MTTYSNPRLEAVVADWPSGRHRVTARFWVEADPRRGERACRTTTHPVTGSPSAPKRLTYAKRVRIVDGDDGRLYVMSLNSYGSIDVMRGTMDVFHEHVSHSEAARIAELVALFG